MSQKRNKNRNLGILISFLWSIFSLLQVSVRDRYEKIFRTIRFVKMRWRWARSHQYACIVEHAGGGNRGGRPAITTTTQSPSCPRIISRSEWGARTPRGKTSNSPPIPNVFIHHTVTPSCTYFSACVRRVKSIQNYHMDSWTPKVTKMLWCLNVSHSPFHIHTRTCICNAVGWRHVYIS